MKRILFIATIGALTGLVFWLIAVFATNVTALVLVPVSVVLAPMSRITNANLWLIGVAQAVYFSLVALAIDFLSKFQMKFKCLLLGSFVLLLVFLHTIVYYQARLNQINEVAAKALVDALVKIAEERDPGIFGNTKADQNNESME